ncbi:hypothetical protein [Pantoea coffeiphila]|uniref:hypothetical protein n=1 Tax=Pantoea coffeiphila TaxID=1465635 RepID=UPI0019600F98|nr:hypothetical protein [Pantoea coffeiphila]MBM7341058.1 hypothetical protein [Pantoea coffeiphila]
MVTALALFGLIMGAWSVRSICIKQAPHAGKIAKSLFAAVFFLGVGGLGAEDESKVPLALVLVLVGGAVQYFCNRKYQRSGDAA